MAASFSNGETSGGHETMQNSNVVRLKPSDGPDPLDVEDGKHPRIDPPRPDLADKPAIELPEEKDDPPMIDPVDDPLDTPVDDPDRDPVHEI